MRERVEYINDLYYSFSSSIDFHDGIMGVFHLDSIIANVFFGFSALFYRYLDHIRLSIKH